MSLSIWMGRLLAKIHVLSAGFILTRPTLENI